MSEIIRNLHEAIALAEQFGMVSCSDAPRSSMRFHVADQPVRISNVASESIVQFKAEYSEALVPTHSIYSIYSPPDNIPSFGSEFIPVLREDGTTAAYDLAATWDSSSTLPVVRDRRLDDDLMTPWDLFETTLGHDTIQGNSSTGKPTSSLLEKLCLDSIRKGTLRTVRTTSFKSQECLADYSPVLSDAAVQTAAQPPGQVKVAIAETQTYSLQSEASLTTYSLEVQGDQSEEDNNGQAVLAFTTVGPTQKVGTIGGVSIYKPDRRAHKGGDVDIVNTAFMRKNGQSAEDIALSALRHTQDMREYLRTWGDTLWFLAQACSAGDRAYHAGVEHRRNFRNFSATNLALAQSRDSC